LLSQSSQAEPASIEHMSDGGPSAAPLVSYPSPALAPYSDPPVEPT
jgi:hypothetical protein